MPQPREVLAQNLKALRKRKDWNQEDLAEATGLGVQAIRKLETQRTWVSSQSLAALAEALSVTPGKLLTGEWEEQGQAKTTETTLGAVAEKLDALNQRLMAKMEALDSKIVAASDAGGITDPSIRSAIWLLAQVDNDARKRVLSLLRHTVEGVLAEAVNKRRDTG